MKPVKVSAKQLTYRNPFLQIYLTRANFGEFNKDYYVVHFGPRAGIVAVRDGEVLLVRQYRFLLDELSWELPGGTIEEGEEPMIGAIRECYEETGVTCRNLRQLIVYYPGLDNVDNRTTIFYTEDVEVTNCFVSTTAEVREIVWVPLEKCVEMIFKQGILDAMSIAGLLAYDVLRHNRGQSNHAQWVQPKTLE
jgi:8-oxo-dGTP pyrophosphatase MutT (NUDIX family)